MKDFSVAGEQTQFLLHDILNYLTPVNAYFDYTESILDTSLGHDMNSPLQVSGKKALRELNELCKMYRLLVLDRYEIISEELKVAEIVETVLEILSYSYDLRDLNLENTLDEKFRLKADKGLFTQCLINIFKNAFENQDENNLRLAISAKDNKLVISNPVCLEVRKNYGSGIGLQFQAKAFCKLNKRLDIVDQGDQFTVIVS